MDKTKDNKDRDLAIIGETSGCWKREETPGEIAAETRLKFTANFKRRQS